MTPTVSTGQAPGQLIICPTCSTRLESGGKFCGECGTQTGSHPVVNHPSIRSRHTPHPPAVPNQVSYDDLARLEAFRLAQIQGEESKWAPTPSPLKDGVDYTPGSQGSAPAPGFVRKGATKRRQIPEELVREMQSLNALLLREHLFLAMHWTIFVIANIIGFWLAIQCYSGMVGDEVTKIVMALTPLTFINAVALACLAPIRGTRREISRIKEKMQSTRVQIEFSNIL
ncbi:MAG: hypothetical protein AB7W16_09925 [Candidatus Obscuribacterales bacterium]